jgi:transcriptional regulator with GAF, ATPase, and Fis domain
MCKLKIADAPNLRITITSGISRFPIDATTYEGLFALADKALYRGKNKGRNCFIIYLDQKHKNLNLAQDGDKKLSDTEVSFNIFNILTKDENIEENINELFKFLVEYYMFDHICLETQKGSNIEIYHSLSRYKNLKHIHLEKIDKAVGNKGLATLYANDARDNISGTELEGPFTEQNIKGGMYCKVAFKDKEFGYIRIDMTSTVRVWQSTEINFITFIANTIALMLYFGNLSFDDFAPTQPIIVE